MSSVWVSIAWTALLSSHLLTVRCICKMSNLIHCLWRCSTSNACIQSCSCCSAGVVPDLSPTGSSSSGLQTASDSMYNHSFNMFDTMDMQSGMSTIPACINPYFASYDQDLLSPAFSKRGLCGLSQRAPSHFIPTSSHAASMQMHIVPTSQVPQAAVVQRPASAASYTVPKEVLRVGDEKPMDREARVAR